MILLVLASVASAASLRATVEVTDQGTTLVDAVVVGGQVPSAPGPLQVVDASGRVLATAAVPEPRVRSVLSPDGSHDTVWLHSALIRVDVPWPEAATELRLGEGVVVPRVPPPAQAIEVQVSGSSQERLDMLFLGDGYTAGQLDRFAADVERMRSYILSIEPYGAYTGLFNVWRIDASSAQSGASHAGGPTRDTAYDCTYDCGGIERLICCDDSKVMADAAAVPGVDGIIVLVNDPQYGGSGGFNYATAYTGADYGPQVAAHELGHSLVGLWDEYSYGVTSPEYVSPNCAHDPDDVPWTDWLSEPEVDAFAECSYTNYWRPTEEGCMMRTLQDDYCPVCREHVVESIYEHLPGLIASVDPEPGTHHVLTEGDELRIEPVYLGPDDGSLVYSWLVDGHELSTGASFALDGCAGRSGELTLEVMDPTPWVRTDDKGVLHDEATWTFETAGDCEPDLVELAELCGCSSSGTGTAAWLALLLAPLGLRRRCG